MSNSPADTLNALLALITSSVKQVIFTYQEAGYDPPSLDSTKPGPFDSPENTPLHLRQIIQTIEGACAQLCATIAPAGHVVHNV